MAEGARRAGIGRRHFRRLLRPFEVKGDSVVVHGLRGRASDRLPCRTTIPTASARTGSPSAPCARRRKGKRDRDSMTGKQLAGLYRRHLRDRLPGTAVRRSVVYLRPVGDLLRGCHFESSGFSSDRFVVHAFVQPLYVPFPAIDLTYGRRLGRRGERWFHLAEEPEERAMADVLRLIQEQALPLIKQFRTPAQFARFGAELVSATRSTGFVEAVAYSYALAGDPGQARAHLARVLAALTSRKDLLPHERETLRRNQQMEVRLRDDPEEAVADLRRWRAETLRAAGIKDDPPGASPARITTP